MPRSREPEQRLKARAAFSRARSPSWLCAVQVQMVLVKRVLLAARPDALAWRGSGDRRYPPPWLSQRPRPLYWLRQPVRESALIATTVRADRYDNRADRYDYP